MNAPAAIVGASCHFASAPTLPLADVAVRAPLALLSRHPFFVDRGGMRVRVNAVFDLEPEFSAKRWCTLARAALGELADTLAVQGLLPKRRGSCALWLVLPPGERAGVPADLADRLRLALQDERFGWTKVHTMRGGHAAGVHALRQAAQADGSLGVVLGVDCWGHPHALQWLEEHGLLHGAHALHEARFRPNPYGRVPGEAAAAVAILPGAGRRARWGRTTVSKPAAPPWAMLSGSALAEEGHTWDASTPCLGAGLTRAALGALDAARVPVGAVQHVSTDLNGEPYRTDEFGFTALQLAARLAPGWKRSAHTLVTGDVGSASVVLQTALAAYSMYRERDPRSAVATRLILSTSDDTLRAALALTSAPISVP
ncbi:beta-ketoacyl synthase [Aquincola sp. S2]|uniref:Beta-ketoacyl synthase n=1 Tax=Pseudaquabacterium terrae TaxID=2732868 RepID=A0ABX2EE54_9BURK|nr:beta-ketoacyl synthase [Aquabacterium terrae]NRF66897.1 beta-ketoacyl synthase [Aquabacterium terrae]